MSITLYTKYSPLLIRAASQKSFVLGLKEGRWWCWELSLLWEQAVLLMKMEGDEQEMFCATQASLGGCGGRVTPSSRSALSLCCHHIR